MLSIASALREYQKDLAKYTRLFDGAWRAFNKSKRHPKTNRYVKDAENVKIYAEEVCRIRLEIHSIRCSQ